MLKTPLQWSLFGARLDPVKGSEQAGRRPVLVISNEVIHQSLPIVTILPVTSLKEGRRIYSTEVLLKSGTAGLKHDSIVMAHQIRTISKERLETVYGTIEDANLQSKIRQALRVHLDL